MTNDMTSRNAPKTVGLADLKKKRPVDEKRVAGIRDDILAKSRAHRLAELRKTYHLTQKDVAAELGIDQSRVSRIERGDLTHTELGTLAAFVEALGGKLEVNVRVGEERHHLI